MSFQVLTLTDKAAERVLELTRAAGEDAGIRIGVKKGGCAGMEYTLELAESPKRGDDIVESAGARVFVDPSATLFLLGTQLDVEETKLRSGFVFNNPNQVSACGCGESVELRPAAEPSGA